MLPDLSGIEKHPDATNGRIMSPTQMPTATLDLSAALNGNANLSSHMLELSTLVWKRKKSRVVKILYCTIETIESAKIWLAASIENCFSTWKINDIKSLVINWFFKNNNKKLKRFPEGNCLNTRPMSLDERGETEIFISYRPKMLLFFFYDFNSHQPLKRASTAPWSSPPYPIHTI